MHAEPRHHRALWLGWPACPNARSSGYCMSLPKLVPTTGLYVRETDMVRRLYAWSMEKISSKAGEKWLALLAFAESTFFPIPVDMLLIPMMLAARERIWRLASIVTAASILGAMSGYLIGAVFFDLVAQPIIDFYGYTEKFNNFSALYKEYGILIIIVAGLTPIPFKVAAIASGAFGVNPLVFFLACFPARAPRFFAEAALFWFIGPSVRTFIERYMGWVMAALIAIGIGGFVALKYI